MNFQPIVPEEGELLLQLRKGDRIAFDEIFNRFADPIHTYIRLRLNGSEEADDVLQEVFVKIWRQTDLYDATKGRLFTWMMNIARNASIDMLRSKNYQKSSQNRELTENVYEESGSMVTNTDKIGLRKLVHTLKDEQKVLVELSYFEGYTQDEISKMLNIPLGTVKTRLRAALLQLRELVKT